MILRGDIVDKSKAISILNSNISKTMGCTDMGVVGYIASIGAYTLRKKKIKSVYLVMSEEEPNSSTRKRMGPTNLSVERAKFNELPSIEFSQVAKIQLANINLLYKLGTLKLPKMVKKYRSGKVIEQESTFRSLEHEGTKVIAMTPRWDVDTPELQTWQNELIDRYAIPVNDYDNWLDDLP